MDIRIAISKYLVYTTLISFLTIFYLCLIYITEKLFQGIIGYQSLLTSIIFASFIAIIFIPARNYIQRLIDKIIFKGSYTEIAEHYDHLKEEVAQKEKFKAVATLASGLAHEIRNPLTIIYAFAEHLPRKMNDKEFLNKFSKLVGKEVQRIDSLIQQLLDFAKPSPAELKPVDVNEVIKETLDLLASKFMKHKIKIVRDANSEERNAKDNRNSHIAPRTSTLADRNQLKQVFLNLFLNAIDAMPNGGSLTVSIHDSRNAIRVSISDTGPGIAKADLKHLFDPFFTKKDHGTGLGLSIVKGIIQEHKGKISVDSEEGNGTEFRIELPLTNHEPRETSH